MAYGVLQVVYLMRQQFTAPNGDDIMIDLPEVPTKTISKAAREQGSAISEFRYAFRKANNRPPTGNEIHGMLREAMRKKKK